VKSLFTLAWPLPYDDNNAMKLWLVRHAKPLLASGVCYGRLDVAADAAATVQCAAALAGRLPGGTRVACSPLQRCEQLAHVLYGLRPDLSYKTDSRLQEMDFGLWEGQAWQAIARAELDAWSRNFANYTAGQHGENVSRFMARVGAAFDALGSEDAEEPGLKSRALTPALSRRAREKEGAPQSQRKKAQEGNTLWITHAGVIRAVELIARGLRQIARAEQWPTDAPDYGQWRTLTLQLN
jgi:alpha-ribazole phosphatase